MLQQNPQDICKGSLDNCFVSEQVFMLYVTPQTVAPRDIPWYTLKEA